MVIQVWRLSTIYHTREPCLPCIIKTSNLGTLYGVLKKNIHSLWTWYEGEYWRAQRWQIIGMRPTWISFKAIGRQMGYHYTVNKTHPNQHLERLVTIQKTTCNVAAWRQGIISLGQTDAIRNQSCSVKTMVTK